MPNYQEYRSIMELVSKGYQKYVLKYKGIVQIEEEHIESLSCGITTIISNCFNSNTCDVTDTNVRIKQVKIAIMRPVSMGKEKNFVQQEIWELPCSVQDIYDYKTNKETLKSCIDAEISDEDLPIYAEYVQKLLEDVWSDVERMLNSFGYGDNVVVRSESVRQPRARKNVTWEDLVKKEESYESRASTAENSLSSNEDEFNKGDKTGEGYLGRN